MNLTMYGSHSRGNPPSYDHRTTAVTGSPRTSKNYAMGTSGSTSSVSQRTVHPTTYGSSYGSSSRFLSTRKLPKGPGPLPDRFNLDRHPSSPNGEVRFVSPYKSSNEKYSKTGYSPAKTTSSQRDATERKTSNDSGYGSSSNLKNRYGSSSTLAGRRSKSFSSLDASLSQLSIKDEPATSKSYYTTKTVPSTTSTTRADSNHGMSSRTKTLENITKLDENHNIYVPSRYSTDVDPSKRTTINSFSSTTNNPISPTSTAGTSTGFKARSLISDYNENRKEIISATPTSLRRNSKSSTSSSSPSTPSGSGYKDGLVGLRNLGNTCFMNSILQCLSQSIVLTEYMMKGRYTKQINSKSSMKGKLIQAYADLIKSMWKQSHSETAISAHSFKTQIQRFAPRFVGYNQQDAQEFLRFLLEGLHDDLNSVHNKPKYKMCEFNDSLSDNEKAEKSWKHYLARDNSKITDLFVGQLKSTLRCTECGHKSVTFDPFWDLSLPIPRKSISYSSYDSRNITIQNCMELFTKEEVLDGDERPTCEKCKKKRKSTKKFTIQRFPQILVLHLKRFSGSGFRSKLQTNVDFPTETKLDLKQFAADSTESRSAHYSLYAVSNHSGTTYGGHYTAYCKHPLSHEWHCFNDSSVDSIPVSRVGGPNTYILFYHRVDTISSL